MCLVCLDPSSYIVAHCPTKHALISLLLIANNELLFQITHFPFEKGDSTDHGAAMERFNYIFPRGSLIGARLGTEERTNRVSIAITFLLSGHRHPNTGG